MADFATWVVAAEPALDLPEGDFLRAYARARAEAIETNIDTSTVEQWLRALADKGGFTGTATELFDLADEKLRRASDWPKNARTLSGELRRLAPALRAVDVRVEFKKESTRAARRLIVIGSLEREGERPSDASESSDADSSQATGSDAKGSVRTQAVLLSDASWSGAQIRSDASDAADAKSSIHSNGAACAICGRTDFCQECQAETGDAEVCSKLGCGGEIYMYDAAARAWCELHAGVEAAP